MINEIDQLVHFTTAQRILIFLSPVRAYRQQYGRVDKKETNQFLLSARFLRSRC